MNSAARGSVRRLVNDLLDAERARRGELCLEVARFDLRSIVEDAARTFGELARQRTAPPSPPTAPGSARFSTNAQLSKVGELPASHSTAPPNGATPPRTVNPATALAALSLVWNRNARCGSLALPPHSITQRSAPPRLCRRAALPRKSRSRFPAPA